MASHHEDTDSVMEYSITPTPKPRMTQRDKWKKRPATLKYFAFKDECRLKGVYLPKCGAHITFVIPMPKSWSKKKKESQNNSAHQQRPDVDNLLKALMDAVYGEDCGVYDVRISKYWGINGKIIVE